MLISAVQAPVRTNLPCAATTFSIQNLAKLFKTFSNIYNDPLLAVPREIICNAFDANPTGVCTVILPSALCPFLTISDAGAGMNRKFMMTHYTAVGFSTRDHDNEANGGFGWGRLSAFAISKSFTVTTQGQIYALSMDEFGIPQIHHVGEAQGEEVTGTHVRISIPSTQRSDLTRKVQQLLQWIDPTKYKVIGATIEPQSIILEGTDYKLCPGNKVSGVLIGEVFYPVDQTKLDIGYYDKVPTMIVPKFGIGELELPPSRESVTYDKRNNKLLLAKYDKIKAELPPALFDHLRALPDWDRLELISNLNPLRTIHNKWMDASGKVAEDQGVEWHSRKWGDFIERELERVNVKVGKTEYKPKYGYQKTGLSSKARYSSSMEVRKRPTERMFWNDVKDRVYARVENINTNTSVWVLHPSDAVPTLEEFTRLTGLTAERLSDRPGPAQRPKTTKSPPKILDARGIEYSDLPTDAVWVETDSLVLRREEPRPDTVYVLSKTAQKYWLEDTHEYLEDWRTRVKNELQTHPGLKAYLAARQVTVPYYLRDFFQKNPSLFPEITQEFQDLEQALKLPNLDFLPHFKKPKVNAAKTPKLNRFLKSKAKLVAYLRALHGASRDEDLALFL